MWDLIEKNRVDMVMTLNFYISLIFQVMISFSAMPQFISVSIRSKYTNSCLEK